MKRALHLVAVVFRNLGVFFAGLFCGRSRKNVLVGSWGGEKFADNSRYLFGYLHSHKDELGLSHVVWATRDEWIMTMLRMRGCEAVLLGTKESRKWHLKCGVHIICNMKFGFGKFGADLDTQYSFGAKKVQLWHGVGVKAIGKASNKTKAEGHAEHRASLLYDAIKTLTTDGGWYGEYFLCTSEKNRHINYITNHCRYDRMFLSAYPRHSRDVELLEEEKKVVESLKNYAFAILYLPTFRSDYAHYTHPLKDAAFLEFLEKHNVAFIEKPHSAATYSVTDAPSGNVICLAPSFDINVLYDHVGCVISDYSSAAFDGIYKKVPTVLYVPDLDDFKNGDVGLLLDLEDYFDGIFAKSIPDCLSLLEKIDDNAYFDERTKAIYAKVRTEFFGDKDADLAQIWKDILAAIRR